MLLLCRDLLVSLCTQDLHHVAQRRQHTLRNHAKDSGSATADQGNALLILGYRLLCIAALNIPEYNLRQLIAVEPGGLQTTGSQRVEHD